jgi:hypothetical protein
VAAPRLKQRNTVSLDAVRRRAREFPLLAGLIEDQIGRLAHTTMHRDTAPRVLALMGEAGANTRAFLRGLEETVQLFGAQNAPGWENVRRELVRANDRANFLATAAELALARWFHRCGMTVAEFDPPTRGGCRADLRVTHNGDELYVEVTSPGPPADDLSYLNTLLHVELERVQSGLAIEVNGFDIDASRLDTLEVTRKHVEKVVREFRRNAARVDTAHLPALVVVPRSGQPVSVTAVGHDPETSQYTHVTLWSSETGFVPNVARLVDRIRAERRQLPEGKSGAVFVDLSRWSDFRSAGYYLAQAAERLRAHEMPAFVGSFLWERGLDAYERSALWAEPAWRDTVMGSAVYNAWSG